MPNDNRDARPLINLLTAQLVTLGEQAIHDLDHEAFTLVIEELGCRTRNVATQEARRLRKLAGRELILIPNLGNAFALSCNFTPKVRDGRHVYIVLLVRPDGKIGFYVGQTGLEPAERFRRHLSGQQASRHVRQHGRQLLGMLTSRFRNMSNDDADRIEASFADALRKADFWVEGGH